MDAIGVMNDAGEREALRLAIERLPLAVLLIDSCDALRPMNGRADRLLAVERIGARLDQAAEHPLARYVHQVRENGREPAERASITFPSGNVYSIEPAPCAADPGNLLLYLEGPNGSQTGSREHLLAEWHLTERERQVALHLASGLSTTAICEALQIAPSTLKTHLSRVLEKSGAHTRSEFLAKLLRLSA